MPIARILMVDDEEDLELLIRQRFRRRIRKGEYEFLFARNGEEALETLQENPDIRLVLSDINMPVMDGLTLLSQLESADPDLCAVIISAYGDMPNIRAAMNRGAFDFVTKPIDFKDLRITIEKTLKHINMVQQALSARDRLVALRQELSVAKNVQMSVLPGVPPPSEHFDLYAQVKPAREIGGDFYDYFLLDDDHLGLVMADVSGKGMPAALFTMVTRALLKSAARTQGPPALCLGDVNEILSQDNDACMFVTLFYGVLDLRDGSLRYTNAGHNPPRLMHGDGRVEPLPSTGNFPLGIVPGQEFQEREIQLASGDALFLYTDGITEACDVAEEEFGEHRLDGYLQAEQSATMRDLVDVVCAAVEEFAMGMEQFDDMTCLAVRWKAAKSAEGICGQS